MGFKIEDGKGRGYSASVNSRNEINVSAASESLASQSSENGDAYSFPSDFIALSTTGTGNGILYIKNTSSIAFRIESIRVSCESSVKWKVIKNPTAGTLISAGTSLTPVNLNFNSGNVFEGTVTVGANGLTVTDGNLLAQAVVDGVSVFEEGGEIFLFQNNSIAITAEIDAGTPDVGCTIIGFYNQ